MRISKLLLLAALFPPDANWAQEVTGARIVAALLPVGQYRLTADALAPHVLNEAGFAYSQEVECLAANLHPAAFADLDIADQNHANFFGVGTGVGASNYGQVTSTREPRRMQLALKLEV